MIKPLPEAPESSSLDKVTSTLLHPLTSHSDIAQFARARSRSSRQKTPPRTLSGDREKDGEKEHLSDGSWSVVSDSGNGEVPALSAEIEAKSR